MTTDAQIAPAEVWERRLEPVLPADHDAAFAVETPRAKTSSPWSWRRWLGIVLLAAIAAYAVGAGFGVRKRAWFATQGVHFRGDITSGWAWGDQAARQGLFSFYDDVEADYQDGHGRRNDYTPLRLVVVTLWANWTHTHFPNADSWQDDYDFTAPMLHANTTAELSAAVLACALIWLLVARHRGPNSGLAGPAAGVFGGILLWLNPAVIWDGHCWPQWDVWLVPFFLAAALAACLDSWFVAGCCVVIGAFFKGQMLLGAPVLLLWPLFQFRLNAVYRLLAGVLVATAALGTPWMHPGMPAIVWVCCCCCAATLVAVASHGKLADWRWRVGLFAAAILLAWPWQETARLWAYGSTLKPLAIASPLALIMPLALLALVPRRLLKFGIAMTIAVSLLLTMPLYGSSSTWLSMGFAYGTEKFENMFTGSGSWNVPAMLIEYWHWGRNAALNTPLGGPVATLSEGAFMRCVYFASLAVCGLAAAIQSKRQDRRLLAALAVPWLLCFLLMPQMHGRYSIWAAAFSCLLAGVNVGLALLGLLLSTVAMLGIMENQYLFVRDYDRPTLDLLQRLDPHLGWVLVVIAVIYLYVALTPGRGGKRRHVSGTIAA